MKEKLLQLKARVHSANKEQSGLGSIILIIVELCLALFIGGMLIVNFWPQVQTETTAVASLTGTDAGTTAIKSGWPIGVAVVGIVIIVAIIMWGVNKLHLIGH